MLADTIQGIAIICLGISNILHTNAIRRLQREVKK